MQYCLLPAVIVFTLQKISKELELIVRTTINTHLVYQYRQIPTGHLQYDIACTYGCEQPYEISNSKSKEKHLMFVTCKLLSSFAKSDAEAQLYFICTDKKSTCSKYEIQHSMSSQSYRKTTYRKYHVFFSFGVNKISQQNIKSLRQSKEAPCTQTLTLVY